MSADERTSTKRPLSPEHAQELLDHLAKKTKLASNTHDISIDKLYLDHLTNLVNTFHTYLEKANYDNSVEDEKRKQNNLTEIPSFIPPEVHFQFLASCGFLHIRQPNNIIRFILTLELLNSNQHGCLMQNIQQLFCSSAWEKNKHQNHQNHQNQPLSAEQSSPNVIEHLIRANLLLCQSLDPAIHLKDTCFESIPKQQYYHRIKRLQKFHEQNITLYRQIIEIKNARNLDRDSLPLFYPEVMYVPEEKEEKEELEPHEQLYYSILQHAFCRGYRKTELGVYEEHIATDEYDKHIQTNWFKLKYDTFTKFIFEEFEGNTEQQRLLIKRKLHRLIPDYLTSCRDEKFPNLVMKRNLFSFLNGIFDANEGIFYTFQTADPRYQNVRSIAQLDLQNASCNYFHVTIPLEWFDPNFDLDQIDCPSFNKILTDQKWPLDTIHCFEFFLGRLVEILDGYGMTPFIVGPGGTGKTVFIMNFAKIFPPEKVGNIMDDCEERFVDQHLRDKFLVIANDITKEIKVSTARFNSWVTLDTLAINIKHKEAICKKWDKTMIWASNEFPGFKTKAGSGDRRLAIFNFSIPIKHANTDLEAQCKDDIPFYLIRTRLRYLRGLKEYGSKSLWEKKANGEWILPQMIRDNRKEYTAQNSTPDAFLDSDWVVFGKDFSCSKKEFQGRYDSWNSQQPKTEKIRYPVPCSPLTFANALQFRDCTWDTTTNIIHGLKVVAPKTNQSSHL
jgi:hypothetical protein